MAAPTGTTGPAAGSTTGDVTPPPTVPLGFLVAAAVGLIGAGLAAWFSADLAVVAPTDPGVVSAVHVAVLAFLTTAVMGALHQFGPVVGRRPLRSVPAARVSLVGMVLGAWMLPSGFAHGPEALIPAGGALVCLAVALSIWNLSSPLAARDGGVPVIGLRLALAYLALTVSFGIVYAVDRSTGWFPLLSNRVLAHAHLGLLGWMGLTYISVAEKLWPMFLLAHRPSDRSGRWAVGGVATGTLFLTFGMLVATPALAVAGGAVVAVGLAAHIASLWGCVRHRRRQLELLHAFLFASTAFLIAAMLLGAVGGLAPMAYGTRARLLSAEVAAFVAWLGLAVVGHVHKIVPFIAYSALQARGVRANRTGGPLLFTDLFDSHLAVLSFAGTTTGFAALVSGLAVGAPQLLAIGGVLLALTGALTAWNLWSGSRQHVRPTPSEHEVLPREEVLDALRTVFDPELGLDVVSLGLVYEVAGSGDHVRVDMTLTTPGCPVSESLPEAVRDAVQRHLPDRSVEVRVVWDPPWTPERLSDEALGALGLPSR